MPDINKFIIGRQQKRYMKPVFIALSLRAGAGIRKKTNNPLHAIKKP